MTSSALLMIVAVAVALIIISSSATATATVTDIFSTTTTTPPSTGRNQDDHLVVAIGEMQKANYFTFVMLINMAPPGLIQGNLTFLMPKDRALANTMVPANAVADFLRSHSIPSPLLFEHLLHFPTGSLIPTEEPDFTLEVTNNGSRSFHLNNVRIISPNICTAGSSIRCHGIDGVVVLKPATTASAAPTCTNNNNNNTSNSSGPVSEATPPSPSTWPSPAGGIGLTPLNAPPQPDDQNNGASTLRKSGSSDGHEQILSESLVVLSLRFIINVVMTCLVFF